MNESGQKTIVITGCSSGFGRATALLLARHRWRVFATVRKEPDAASLAVEAMGRGAREDITPILCDITDEQQVRELARAVGAATPRLDALMNNAGSAFPAPMELLPISEFRAQLELNVVAQLAVTQALLPLVRAARGTIVNVGSVSGAIALPVAGAYSISKFALEAMSDVLRVELAPFGVRVVLMQPGSSPTAIWETSRRRGRQTLADRKIDSGVYARLISTIEKFAMQRGASGFAPEVFARAVLKVLNNPDPPSRVPVPARAGWRILQRRLLPDWLWDRQVRRVIKW